MPVLPGDTPTANFGLDLIQSSRPNWAPAMNNNLIQLDAILAAYIAIANLKGIWLNSTQYNVGDTVVDNVTGTIFKCNVANISAAFPVIFSQERVNHSTYWGAYTSAAHQRGTWIPNGTAYAINDFVVSGSQYAICVVGNNSGVTFAGDIALGYWSVLIDLSLVGSNVLPVPGGAPDANKFVVVPATGLGYTIVGATTALANLGATTPGINMLVAGSISAQRTLLALGSAALLAAGTGPNNAVQLDGSSKLPAVDASALINLPGSLSTTTYLTGGPVTLSTVAKTNIINTGVIGAAGQMWLIAVYVDVVNSTSASLIEYDIHDGTTIIQYGGGFVPAVNASASTGFFRIVVLTGPTTFTLRGQATQANSNVQRQSFINAGLDKSTNITAVRIS